MSSSSSAYQQQRNQSQRSSKLVLGHGRYLCQKTLGCGTYGRVLQCLDQKTNTVVAVKVSQKESAYTRAALVEYHTLVSLQEHTHHTVRVYEQFEERGHICVALELLSQNLFELGRKRVESRGDLVHVDELRQISFCVFSALMELHRLGLMHCDIKPENVMVRSGRAPPHTGLQPSSSAAAFVRSLGGGGGEGAQRSREKKKQENGGGDISPSDSSSFDSSPGGDGHHSISGITSSPSSSVAAAAAAQHGGGLSSPTLSPSMSGVAEGSESRYQGGQQSSAFALRVDDEVLDWNNTCLIDYGAVRRLNENNYFDIQSMWYRAPEVLCHVPYTPQIDSWSMGCLLYEMYTGRPLFMGNDPMEQVQLIVEVVGSFPHLRERYPKLAQHRSAYSHETVVDILRRKVESARLKHIQKIQGRGGSRSASKMSSSSDVLNSPRSPAGSSMAYFPYSPQQVEETLLVDLMAKLLCPDVNQRITCEQALQHPFFTTFTSRSPIPCGTPTCMGSSAAASGQSHFIGGLNKMAMTGGTGSFSSGSAGLSGSPLLPSAGFGNSSRSHSQQHSALPNTSTSFTPIQSSSRKASQGMECGTVPSLSSMCSQGSVVAWENPRNMSAYGGAATTTTAMMGGVEGAVESGQVSAAANQNGEPSPQGRSSPPTVVHGVPLMMAQPSPIGGYTNYPHQQQLSRPNNGAGVGPASNHHSMVASTTRPILVPYGQPIPVPPQTHPHPPQRLGRVEEGGEEVIVGGGGSPSALYFGGTVTGSVYTPQQTANNNTSSNSADGGSVMTTGREVRNIPACPNTCNNNFCNVHPLSHRGH